MFNTLCLKQKLKLLLLVSYYPGGVLMVRPCQVECFGIAQHKLKAKPGKITLRLRSE